MISALDTFEDKLGNLVDAGSWLNSLIDHESWIGKYYLSQYIDPLTLGETQ